MMTPVLIGSAVLAPIAGLIVDDLDWPVLSAFALAAWVVLGGLRDIVDKTRHKGLAKGVRGLTRSYWGMQLAHLGLAVCALGVVLSSNNSAERDLRMAPGESVELGVITSCSRAPGTSRGRTSSPTRAPSSSPATAVK